MFTSEVLTTYLACAALSYLGMAYLLSPFNKSSRYFFIPASKSKSSALLLGGLPIVLANVVGILLLNFNALSLLWSAMAMVLAYGGWIDDWKEIRARYKLAFQLFAVGTVSLATVFHYDQPLAYSIFYAFVGMALVNGVNLLDGLDTMAIKINSTIFAGFAAIALLKGQSGLMAVSLLPVCTLGMFYFFNKWPSRLHLGEGGSSHLGFVAFFLGITAFNSTSSGDFSALIPLMIPTTELAVSFSRRLLSGKSPFIGDQLHLHHVLMKKFKSGPMKTSSMIAIFLALTTGAAVGALALMHPLIVLTAYTTTLVLSYFLLCSDSWQFTGTGQHSELFIMFLNEKNVQFIDVRSLIKAAKDVSSSVKLAGLVFKGRDLSFLKSEEFEFVITVNAEYIVRAQKNPKLHSLINKYTSTLDGTIPFWLARMTNRGQDLNKISGSDLIYDVAAFAANSKRRIFLLGGHDESNAGAIKKLREMYPGLEVDGFSPPKSAYPFPTITEENIKARIRRFKPDYVFVAFGIMKQEAWIEDHMSFLQENGARLAVGCGGTFDFVSGKIKRAPKMIQNVGLESAWRLLMEPKWFRVQRILISFLVFLYALRPAQVVQHLEQVEESVKTAA